MPEKLVNIVKTNDRKFATKRTVLVSEISHFARHQWCYRSAFSEPFRLVLLIARNSNFQRINRNQLENQTQIFRIGQLSKLWLASQFLLKTFWHKFCHKTFLSFESGGRRDCLFLLFEKQRPELHQSILQFVLRIRTNFDTLVECAC